MMKIQQFLHEGRLSGQSDEELLNKLKEDLAINSVREGHLILFRYSQMNSPMGNSMVQECRGLILDDRDWSVVCYPYRKFFSRGEGRAAALDWTSVRAYEKVDGSLMTLYRFEGQWQVSSSGMPKASGRIRNSDMIMSELFWKIWNDLGYSLPDPSRNRCYMFEMTSPLTRVQCEVSENILLHGARDLDSLEELDPISVSRENGWATVPIHEFSGGEKEIEEFVNSLNPVKQEGLVLVDGKFNRIKWKSASYVAMAHLGRFDGSVKSLDKERILEIVRPVILSNEVDEVVAYLPEWGSHIREVTRYLSSVESMLTGVYNSVRGLEGKAFAESVKNYSFSTVLFQLKKGVWKNIQDYCYRSDAKKLLQTFSTNKVDTFVVPSITDEDLQDRMKNLSLMITRDKVHYVVRLPQDVQTLRAPLLIWDKRSMIKVDLTRPEYNRVGAVMTYHPSQDGTFNPTVAEIVSQIPEEDLKWVRYFLMKEQADGEVIHSTGLYHKTTTYLYGGTDG